MCQSRADGKHKHQNKQEKKKKGKRKKGNQTQIDVMWLPWTANGFWK